MIIFAGDCILKNMFNLKIDKIPMSRQYLTLFLTLLCIILMPFSASADTYYETSGTYKAKHSVKILDYPDSRASSIYKLSEGDVIHTVATYSAQKSKKHAILCKLITPTSAWMALRLPDGRIGFVWESSGDFEKINSEKADISDEAIAAAVNTARTQYISQAKQHFLWIGIAILVALVLILIANFTDNDKIGLAAGIILIGMLFGLALYLYNNPHSMWFVSPSIVGWGVTILCIFPTFFIMMQIIGEFTGSFSGALEHPVNFIGLLLFGAIVFLMFRAVYLEVTDLITLVIFTLSGVGVRTSSEYGTLLDQTTGKMLTGVRFSGNKAYSGDRTFTDNGSGFYE